MQQYDPWAGQQGLAGCKKDYRLIKHRSGQTLESPKDNPGSKILSLSVSLNMKRQELQNLWESCVTREVKSRVVTGSRFFWNDAICFYLDRYRTKFRGNLRLRPLFSEGFRFYAILINISAFINFAFASPYLFFVSIYVCLL